MTFFAELKRRNVLRAAAAYTAVCWLLIQVVETLFPVFGLSDAAIRAVVIALVIGFVPAMVLAWAFELTPEGFVRDSEVDRASPSIKTNAKRLDRVVMVALALAVGYFAFDKFMLDPARDAALAEAAKEQGRTEAVQEERASGPPVVAVLPFSAVTTTEDSEFFAAGVHDDLLTKLAQLPSMLVISRTSVLQYKDTRRNIREIGKALGADVILEGGVQSAGNRIRINAQLIDAKTDEHLWAETYDRELTTASIFDVQDNIAHAIADALRTTFTAAARSPVPTQNMAAYRAYHEALKFREESFYNTTSQEYQDLLQKAIDLDPSFARPLALLVGSYAFSALGNQDPEIIARAEALLDDLRDLAPGSADHLIAQTYYTYYIVRDYDLALEIASRALELVPSDSYLVGLTAWIKRRQGDFVGMIDTMRLARQLEPTNPTWTTSIVSNLSVTRQYDAVADELEATDVRRAGFESLRALLAVREHGDLGQLSIAADAIAREFEGPAGAMDAWWLHLASRNYAGAEGALVAMPDRPADAPPPPRGLSNKQAATIVTYFFTGDDRLDAALEEGRKSIARLGTTEELLGTPAALSLATITAVEGDTHETERLVRSWYEGGGLDWPARVSAREITCHILGMAGAAEAAVECIRLGLEEPSSIIRFIEPYLPFHDPIREHPAFVELVKELENS
jgi:TolB-like protein